MLPVSCPQGDTHPPTSRTNGTRWCPYRAKIILAKGPQPSAFPHGASPSSRSRVSVLIAPLRLLFVLLCCSRLAFARCLQATNRSGCVHVPPYQSTRGGYSSSWCAWMKTRDANLVRDDSLLFPPWPSPRHPNMGGQGWLAGPRSRH